MSETEKEHPRSKSTKLNGSNYNIWVVATQGELMSANAWRIVNDTFKRPAESAAEYASWALKREEAAGIILKSLEPNQYIHVEGRMDDPVAMWKNLKIAHQSQVANSRFFAIQKLLSAKKEDTETLTEYATRINSASSELKALVPNTLTVTDIIDEVSIHAAVTGLDEREYGSFASSLLLLGNLNRTTLMSAFRNEDIKRQVSSSMSTALSANRARRGNKLICPTCKRVGHTAERCWITHPELRPQRGTDNKKSANTAQGSSTDGEKVNEAAQNASPHSTAHTTSHANQRWNADTGATSHMTPHRHWLQNYEPYRTPIRLANDHVIYSAGRGEVLFAPVIEGKPSKNVVFTNVLHVPDLQNNLLAVLHLTTKHDFTVLVVNESLLFKRNNKIVFTATVQNGVGYLNGKTVQSGEAVFATVSEIGLNLLHRRLAHIGEDRLKQLLSQNMTQGLKSDGLAKLSTTCEHCISAKQHRAPFPKRSMHRAKAPLELIVSDIHGPLPVRTRSGYRYWITFTDDHTRYRHVFLLKAKSEAFNAYLAFEALVENQLGTKIRRFRDDKGGEYIGHKWNEHFTKRGIIHEHTTTATPQQNGISERTNRTLLEGITAMLQDAKLPSYMWGEALQLFVRILNATPTSALPNITPYEAWHKEKPNLSMLRVFGCRAYVHVQKQNRDGLQSHTRKCIYLGFEDGYKGWKCYDPKTKSIVVSRDVIFDETVSPGLTAQKDDDEPIPGMETLPAATVPHSEELEQIRMPHQHAEAEPTSVSQPMEGELDESPNSLEIGEAIPDTAPNEDTTTTTLRRSTRQRNPVNYRALNDPFLQLASKSVHEGPSFEGGASLQAMDFVCNVFVPESDAGDELAYGIVANQNDDLPESFIEAMTRPDGPKWREATDGEIQSLIENGTWELVELPPDKKAIGSRWVFRIKRKADGEVDRYKARLVAKGYSQRPGIDFDEVFAPTTRWAALRIILANGALEGAYIESVDISNAYLNGVLDNSTEVYMKQPEGYHQGDQNRVCRLKKGLYGLKQGGRLWYERLGEVLQGMGFKRLQSDNSVYIWMSNGVKVIIPVFVDDLTLVSKSKDAIDRVKSQLAATFKLKDLGPTSWLLGVQVIYDREKRTLQLSQRQYIVDLLKRFGMTDCKPVATPMVPGSRLSKAMGPSSPSEKEEMQKIPYLNAIGALNYLAICTRPDISYAVGCLARYSGDPGPMHWTAVKHVMRYLKGTMDLKLTYSPSNIDRSFQTWTDADHGGNPDNGKSTSGYMLKIGTGVVSWSSKLQNIVALSTTEAEFVAATSAGTEVVWTRNFLRELGLEVDGPSDIYIDNQSALSVAKNPEHHGRMKHLDLRFFWLRDAVSQKVISISYIPTGDMTADLLTKALSRQLVEKHRREMGLI